VTDDERLDGVAILCTASPLLGVLVRDWLSAHIDVAARIVQQPAQLPAVARDTGGRNRRVLLLLDPRGDDWAKRVGEARQIDSRLAVVVVTARSTYWRQRQWRQRPGGSSDRYLANGVLALDDGPNLLLRALRESLEDPGTETRVWLAQPKHPAAYRQTPDGAPLQDVPKVSAVLSAVELEIAGRDRRDAAAEAGVGYDAVQKALRRLKDDLGVSSEIALGYHLTRLGVFDDPPYR